MNEYAKKFIKREYGDEVTEEDFNDPKFLHEIIDNLLFSPRCESGMFLEETAIEQLLLAEVLLVDGKMKISVLCNDLFWWACADYEEIDYEEIESLWDVWEKDGDRGVMKWCCFKRGMQPQLPIRKRWKADGFWDDELEALKDPGPS